MVFQFNFFVFNQAQLQGILGNSEGVFIVKNYSVLPQTDFNENCLWQNWIIFDIELNLEAPSTIQREQSERAFEIKNVK